MSNEKDKIVHSERLHQKEVKIQKQYKIAKEYHRPYEKWRTLDQPHRMHKMRAMNCGDPNCAMCGNPRKFFGEETIQERKHKQEKYYKDNNYENSNEN